MKTLSAQLIKKLAPEQIFMISVLIVNGGNYIYNLLLGRILGPKEFSDAAVLITLLLVISFVAMTFQLLVARFVGTIQQKFFSSLMRSVYKYAMYVGILIGLVMMLFSGLLSQFFNTSSPQMFIIFGFGVPLYFLMSVNRGYYQGQKKFSQLSITYQLEMLIRLLFTLFLLWILPIKSSNIVSIGIVISLLAALFPFNISFRSTSVHVILPKEQKQQIKKFFVITAFYELTQIIINNSDILLVKHYFDAYQAGLYASLALIGRVVYFMAWMFVMLLLPTVVQLKKQGKSTKKVLFSQFEQTHDHV